jgi:hypothetical protein
MRSFFAVAIVRPMDDAAALGMVKEWLHNRAQSLRDAAKLAESIGPSGPLARASIAYAARLREAAGVLEEPLVSLPPAPRGPSTRSASG